MERDRLNFDQRELLAIFNQDASKREDIERVQRDYKSHDTMVNNHKFYQMTPAEVHTVWMKRINHLYFKDDETRKRYFEEPMRGNYSWMYHFLGRPPIELHFSMFAHSVTNFGTDEQKAKWEPMIKRLDIIGTMT